MQFYTKEDIKVFDQVQFQYIKTELKNHVFRITMNRPEKRNAFTPTMATEITFALAYAHHHSNVRCVVLDAEGPVFCAGADLHTFHDPSSDIQNITLPSVRQEVKLGDAFAQLLKPSIAQVEGAVLAGGFLLVCGCTFVLSVTDATYSLPEVKRGIWPMQVMASLLQITSPRKVLEMAVTGKTYSAEEAYRLGLVTQIAEKDKIKHEVHKLSDLICANAPYAIRLGMEAYRNLSETPENARHAYLQCQLERLLQSEDAREGILAFKEKRPPIWKGM